MWQRKQTIYLVLVLLLTVCVAVWGHGDPLLDAGNGAIGAWAVFTLLRYKQRRRQMQMCRIGQLLLVAWIAYFAYLHYYLGAGIAPYPLYALLPIVNIVLFDLARRGIKHDDNLVRSVDRIR